MKVISARAAAAAIAVSAMALGLPATATPVLFVTQTPIGTDNANSVSTFGNHLASPGHAPRGGDLYIRYDDGTLKNLTQTLGYGTVAGQEIAVREPCVSWSGTKALFAMVIGGTTPGNSAPVFWQIYEITGLGQAQTPVITHVPQPAAFSNLAPCYGSDDRIVFTSDRPRNGDPALYPQLDEYKTTPTVSGLWSMAPDGTDLHILDHNPSGDFNPRVDSFGRIIFGRWDHLQRDPQADIDIDNSIKSQPPTFGVRTYASEAANAAFHGLNPTDEQFPEATYLHPKTGGFQAATPDPVWNADHFYDDIQREFNQFFPWTMNQDGSGHEILNHLGRHELLSTINRSRVHLPLIVNGGDANATPRLFNFLAPKEDPTSAGLYFGIDANEFSCHAAGQVVALYAPVGRNADFIRAQHITNPANRVALQNNQSATANNTGLCRDVMAKTDGTLWASRSASAFIDQPTVADPGPPSAMPLSSRYDFAITQLVQGGQYKIGGAKLIPAGITKSVSYFDNSINRAVTYSGKLWELEATEVVARPVPPTPTDALPAIETNMMMSQLGSAAEVQRFKDWLTSNSLALVVSRDVTRRMDKQQEYNLKVAWSTHVSTDGTTTPNDVGYMQFFEGQQVRGYANQPVGRRVIGRPMVTTPNPSAGAGAPAGAVKLGDDGSMAALVPARRAMSWQMTDPGGVAMVKERYWVNFAPGEMRSCVNCHGINQTDVLGNAPPTNSPQALTTLLSWYQTQNPPPSVVDKWKIY